MHGVCTTQHPEGPADLRVDGRPNVRVIGGPTSESLAGDDDAIATYGDGALASDR